MIKLKVGLKQTNVEPMNRNYMYQLKMLCDDLICNKEYKMDQRVSQQELSIKDKNREDVTISSLVCSDYEIKGRKIIFNDVVNFYIKSRSYDIILGIVQGLFKPDFICIGKTEFEVFSVEATEI